MKRWIKQQRWLAAGVALGAAAVIAGCGGTSSSSSGGASGSSGSSGGSSVLTVESSQQNAITQNFNPYIQSSAATLLGATSLMYEPLLQANAIKPGQYYDWLATGYTWSNGGKSITFTIRPGVKWSNGTPMTAADVAFTFNMLKQYPDANNTGLAVGSASSSGNQVTINFATPQYANLQNIAGQTYIVPESIWSKVGDPGKYTDPNPVGTGPYTVSQFSLAGDHAEGQSDATGAVSPPCRRCSSRPTRRPTPRWRPSRPTSCTGRATSSPACSRCLSQVTPATRCGSRRCRRTASSRT